MTIDTLPVMLKTNSNILTIYYDGHFRRYLFRNSYLANMALSEISFCKTLSDINSVLKKYNAVSYSLRRRRFRP